MTIIRKKVVKEFWKSIKEEPKIIEKQSSNYRKTIKEIFKTIEFKYYLLECGHEERADIEKNIDGMVKCTDCHNSIKQGKKPQ